MDAFQQGGGRRALPLSPSFSKPTPPACRPTLGKCDIRQQSLPMSVCSTPVLCCCREANNSAKLRTSRFASYHSLHSTVQIYLVVAEMAHHCYADTLKIM